MKNFDLKKFLTENKLTSNSRMLNEDEESGEQITLHSVSTSRGEFFIGQTTFVHAADAEQALEEIAQEEYPDEYEQDEIYIDYVGDGIAYMDIPGDEGFLVAVEPGNKFAKRDSEWSKEDFKEFKRLF